MTETSGLGLTTRAGEPTADGAVGRPYPPSARVRLVDPGGRDVAPGDTGEVLFAHPAVMTGYQGEPPPPFGRISSGDLMRQPRPPRSGPGTSRSTRSASAARTRRWCSAPAEPPR